MSWMPVPCRSFYLSREREGASQRVRPRPHLSFCAADSAKRRARRCAMKFTKFAVLAFAGPLVAADPGGIRSAVDDGAGVATAAGSDGPAMEFGASGARPTFLRDGDGEDWNPFKPCRHNGCVCAKDSNCNSGRCSAGFRCADKVSDGGYCGNDGDCKSGSCARQGILKKCRGAGANKIKICAKEMILTTRQPAVGADVRCWDKDPNGDDEMARGITHSDGCATLQYKDQSWDGLDRNPDILCVVTKDGFVEAAPPRLDGHNQYTLAKLEDVTLYRDRRDDAGHDNGCGPEKTEGIGNDLAGWILRFKDQCTMHDHCYYDCQIFLASRNAKEAQSFCDREMLAGMETFCRVYRGNLISGDLIGGTHLCLQRAKVVHGLNKAFGNYDRSNGICPSKNGVQDKSMNNVYAKPTATNEAAMI